MSLIQEALRRQNEEGDEPPGRPPDPSSQAQKNHSKLSIKHTPEMEHSGESVHAVFPVPQEDEPPQDDSEHGTKKIVLVGGIIGGVVLLACMIGGVYFFMRPASAPSVATTTPAPAIVPVTATTATSAESTTNSTPTAIVGVVPLKEAAGDITMAPPPVEEKVVEVPPPPVDAKPAWPLLTLGGTMGRGVNSTALINKQMLRAGDVVEGVNVISVGQDSVVLEFNGEQQTLKGGGTTKQL